MIKRFSFFIAILGGIAFLSLGIGAQIWLSEDDRLLQGDVIIDFKEAPGAGGNEVQALIFIDAPPEMVWSVLTDYQAYAGLFPDLSESELLGRQENAANVKYRVNNLWPVPDFVYSVAYVEDPAIWAMTWNLVEGNYIAYSGAAKVEKYPPEKNTSRLSYSMVRDPGWVTPFLSVSLNNRSLVIDRLVAIRKEVRERKREIENGVQDPNIKPKWGKALFWWDKGPETREGSAAGPAEPPPPKPEDKPGPKPEDKPGPKPEDGSTTGAKPNSP